MKIQPADLSAILKAAGFKGHNPDQHDAMEQAILEYELNIKVSPFLFTRLLELIFSI
jgi:hypothetical protein